MCVLFINEEDPVTSFSQDVLTSSFGRCSAGFRYVVPSAVLNAIVEMKLEDFGGSFLLLASSMYGAKPAAIVVKSLVLAPIVSSILEKIKLYKIKA